MGRGTYNGGGTVVSVFDESWFGVDDQPEHRPQTTMEVARDMIARADAKKRKLETREAREQAELAAKLEKRRGGAARQKNRTRKPFTVEMRGGAD